MQSSSHARLLHTVTTELFIALVQRHRIIYDLSSRGYHDQDRKTKVWTTIAAEFNLTSTVI